MTSHGALKLQMAAALSENTCLRHTGDSIPGHILLLTVSFPLLTKTFLSRAEHNLT